MKKWCIAGVIVFIICMGSHIFAGETSYFQNAPDSELLKQVEENLFEYRNSNGKWPRNVNELSTFARKKGTPLDLSSFGRLTLEKKSADTILIVYSIKNPDPYIAAYAITVDEINPPAKKRSVSDKPVRKIQKLLAEEGYKPGPADGKMGKGTRDAIVQFQRDNGLAATGIPSDTLLKILEQKKLKKIMKTKMWPNGISADKN